MTESNCQPVYVAIKKCAESLRKQFDSSMSDSDIVSVLPDGYQHLASVSFLVDTVLKLPKLVDASDNVLTNVVLNILVIAECDFRTASADFFELCGVSKSEFVKSVTVMP